MVRCGQSDWLELGLQVNESTIKDSDTGMSDLVIDLAAAGEVGLWSLSRSSLLSGTPEFFSLLGADTRRPLPFDSFLNLISVNERDEVGAAFELARQSGQRLSVDFSLAGASKAGRRLGMRGTANGEHGPGHQGLGGALFDLTELQRANELLGERLASETRLRETAEAANRVKDEFVALVSHELRTPLNAMLGWARILQTKEVDAPTLKHAVETIERSARAQSKLIEDLIDSVRISTGKLRLETHSVDLKKVVISAVDLARPAAETKQVSMSLAVDDAPIEVVGDADRLGQVVGNLLSNAVKFTPGGGSIEVELATVAGQAIVTVRDSGLGINADLLPQIFDRFDQAGHANTRRHGGLGLGLALVRQLVDLHGGSVRAESAGEGKGATFVVQLQLRNSSYPAPVSSPVGVLGLAERHPGATSAPLVGISVLVVDDDSDARELTSMLLRKNGAVVRSAASAAEAFSALSSSVDFVPDLLLSDIGMPDEDGYSLIARVRALSPQQVALVPAIALTAFGSAEDRARAFASGFDAHLTKPIEPNQLVDEISRLAPQVKTNRG
jgi:signal transduction histidine kinase/ActR/RegA family two-component response regulator